MAYENGAQSVQAQYGLTQAQGVPPQPSVGRTLDNTIEHLATAAAIAREINGRLNGYTPEAVSKEGQEAPSLSIHERATAAENMALQLTSTLETIRQRL